MQYGFAIDQGTCIGCHACTVACKTEHEIPVGQFRTWVKYVDKGEYPSTTREFGVMRCNHCTDAPCIDICPTNSLFKRDDGIVDFDQDSCIGCKSCIQACPYDAIYIDDDSNTAAKCNFCAHRIDSGLEPACVTVCPTQSIWVGDLDDPHSDISRMLATNETHVRAPEQGTQPNVFYLAADQSVLDPLAAPVDETYLWARPDEHRREIAGDGYGDDVTKARTTYNTAHPRPWGWKVATYLWTKGIGAGALLVTALAMVAGSGLGDLGRFVAPGYALVFTAATAALLVWDLKRPKRFLYILTRPNPRSWLFLGALVLAAYAAFAAAWLGVALAGRIAGVIGAGPVLAVLAWPAIPLSALAAGYTAFLFGQAEARDLWQSPLHFWHLVAQAVMAGGGALLVAAPFLSVTPPVRDFLVVAFALGTLAHLLFVGSEYFGRHATRGAAVAARIATRGRYARTFWTSAALAAVAAALAVAVPGWAGPVAGGVLAQVALVAYETVYVRAGQDVPLS